MSCSPLAGVTVLELGSSIAGPYACRILASFGAEVLKVEEPGSGDPARGWGRGRLGGTGVAYQACNRDKRSVTVDFSDPEELARLQRLIAERADVVLQNLRPGVVERFGLDAATSVAANKQLIYCNLSAFGPDGPLSGRPGYDPLIQAYGGITDATGEPGRDPVRVGVPVIDFGTGMWAAIGILAALQERQRTGAGCVVDAVMFETALAWQTLSSAIRETGDEPPRRTGLSGPIIVPNTGYDTADGKLLVTVGTERQFARFCDAIGLPDLPQDPRFASNEDRVANAEAFNAVLTEQLRTQPRDYWTDRLDAVDVPCAPILELKEALVHPQTAVTGILQPSPDGEFRITGLPLRFDGERPAFRRAAPALGEATQAAFAFMDGG